MTDVPATADASGPSTASRKWLIYGGRATLTLLLLLGWALVPHASGGHLRAPVARALEGACVSQPALCTAP